MLARLTLGRAIAAAIDISFGAVQLTVPAMGYAARVNTVITAYEPRRAGKETAVPASRRAVGVCQVDKAVAVIVDSVVTDLRAA